jgi:hypothetical protein
MLLLRVGDVGEGAIVGERGYTMAARQREGGAQEGSELRVAWVV